MSTQTHVGMVHSVSNPMGSIFIQKRFDQMTELTGGNTLSHSVPINYVLNVEDIDDHTHLAVNRFEDAGYTILMTSYDAFYAFPKDKSHMIEAKTSFKNNILALYGTVATDSTKGITAAKAQIREIFSDVIHGEDVRMRVRWYFQQDARTESITIEEGFSEKMYPEAYPDIENVTEWVNEYLDSPEQILVLYGPPGTGKTRLIRWICYEMAKRKNDRLANIMYTVDKQVLANDLLFTTLLSDEHQQALILEDLDQHLGSRKTGNDVMTRLLTGSDGFVSNQNKKIIITTNLLNIDHIDEALLRPGRCFDARNIRPLNRKNAMHLATTLNSSADVTYFTDKEYTLGEIFKSVRQDKKVKKVTRGIGFHNV